MFLEGAAIFFGSFLLFLLQPMAARAMLPSFGGSAAVWTTCLAAYETLLLAGYGWGAAISGADGRRRRTLCRMHVFGLVAGGAWLVAASFRGMAARDTGLGTSVDALATVAAFVGVPYVLLSANSTLVQALAPERDGKAPYWLYGVSNLGSLFGLAAYPFALEPFVPVKRQVLLLGVGVLCLASLVALLVAGRTGPASAFREPVPDPGAGGPSPWRIAAWTAIPAASCAFMTATTTLVCSDISPLPLLWTVFLGLFLLSYAAGFTPSAQRALPVLGAAAAVSMFPLASLAADAPNMQIMTPVLLLKVQRIGIPAYAATLLFLHAWLYALRPGGRRLLGRYYLCNALGGAVGGILAGVVAPAAFRDIAEYPISLAACAALVAAWAAAGTGGTTARGARIGAGAVLALFAVLSPAWLSAEPEKTAYRGRDFYGTVIVRKGQPFGPGLATELFHGRTRHGVQAETPEADRKNPTSYYGDTGGGMAISAWRATAPGRAMRVLSVGLGAGTMAAWAEPGDEFAFFEISPEVIRVATDPELFTFLSDCRGSVEVTEGDGRMLLEKEERDGAKPWDVIEIDAFAGDAIPMQLVSDEAFDLYRKRLAPGGILGLHVSNWQFDLLPLLKRQRDRLGMECLVTTGAENGARRLDETVWAWYAEKAAGPMWQDLEGESASGIDMDVFSEMLGNSRKAKDVRLGRHRFHLPAGTTTETWIDVPEAIPITDASGSMMPYVSKRVRQAFF